MRNVISLAVCFMASMMTPLPLRATPNYETPTRYYASSLLPAEILSGKNYSIAPIVGSDGFLFHFMISSKYGAYFPIGLEELNKRVHEILALDALEEFTDSKVFLNAAKKGGIKLLRAPAEVLSRVAGAIEDPDKVWETMKKVPSGVEGLFGSLLETAGAGISAAVDAITSDDDSDDDDEEDTLQSRQDAITDKAVDFALDKIGYNKAENSWYKRYDLDPYTSNQPLRERISEIAKVETTVGVVFKLVPGVVDLGLVADASGYLSTAERLARYSSPEVLRQQTEDNLRMLGLLRNGTSELQENSYFSPPERKIYSAALRKLSHLSNKKELLTILDYVDSRQKARFMVRVLEFLSSTDRTKNPYIKALQGIKIPVLIKREGTAVIPLALDHVIWQKRFAEGIDRIRSKLPASAPILVSVSGTVSKRCRAELESRGITVVTNLKF